MKNGLFVVLGIAWLASPIISSFAQLPSLSETRVKAEQGDVQAQHNLGAMYEKGLGVAKDDVQAVLWYRKAAGQGNALGQNNLGAMYRDGRGVAKDDALAVTWFRKAAEQGNDLAQKNLVAMSTQGGDAKSAEAVMAPLPANTKIVRGTDFDVGRVSLRMLDAAWEDIGTSRRGLAYTGDQSGEIPSVTRYLLLRDDDGKFRAALVVTASRGVGAVRMTYTQNCRPQQNVHVVDNARRNFISLDCLRVTGSISPQRYLELAAPDMLPEFATRKVALPRAGYAVIDDIGLENGSYLAVQAVFAADFNLPNDASANDALPAGVKPEAVAWGGRLAEAVRSCAHSLSGALAFPPITARAK